MTKAWNDIREQASHLYAEGHSLEQVRIILSRERKFNASVRAFRIKLKEWKVTRASLLKELRSQQAGPAKVENASGDTFGTACGNATTEERDPGLDMNAVHIIGPAVSKPLHGLPRTSDVRVQSGQDLAPSRGPAAPSGSESSAGTLTPDHQSSLSGLEENLQPAQSSEDGCQIERPLTGTTFDDGTQTILHLAAGKGDYWTIEYALDYVRAKRMSVDVINRAGYTPLELAIEACQPEAVSILLEAGASVHRRRDHSTQPLHLAIRVGASADICELLLKHGADPNAPEGDNNTPLALAWYRTHERDALTKQEAFVIAETLLDRGAVVPDVTSVSFRANRYGFLCQWILWKRTHACTYPCRKSWLRRYFSTDYSPLCWLPLQCCPSRECENLASFVFSHTDLGMSLVACSDSHKYATEFVQAILSPCGSALPASYLSRSTVLRLLLETLPQDPAAFFQHQDLLLTAVKQSRVDDVCDIFSALLEAGIGSQKDRRDALIHIAQGKLPSRLQLAKQLLAPCQGLLSQDFYDHTLATYCNDRSANAASAQRKRTLYADFSSDVLEEIGLHDELLSDDAPGFIAQAAVHVLTKLMLETELVRTGLSTEARLALGIKFREMFDLPSLPIPSEILTGLKDVFRTQSFEGRDYKDPDNPMGCGQSKIAGHDRGCQSTGLDIP